MWELLARSAAADATERIDPLARLDHLALVHCQSWGYDRPVDRLAARLGGDSAHRVESILAGTSPQRLLDDAAARMLRGESSVALVVGGEALATRRAFDRAGESLPWSHPGKDSSAFPVDLDEWYLPSEIAHGILPAWLTFALLEQARWARRGGDDTARHQLGAVMSALNDVAATNPDAWFAERRTEVDITVAGPDNRMVASPYTKRMTAFMDVDMGAANLMVTKAIADGWRIPEERRVYLRGWGFARDAVHIAGRESLDTSVAMTEATGEALRVAGVGLDDVDTFDLYSCFGSAVQFATDAMEIDIRDTRPISVTGGLAYHGGPSSNYMSHSISHLVDRMRDGTSRVGMCTGVGMHMTKHVAAVYAREPGALDRWVDHGNQHWADPASPPERRVVATVTGPGTVAAATVIHDRGGAPEAAVAILDLPDGSRCYGRTTDDQVIEAVLSDDWVDRRVRLSSAGGSINDIRLS